MGHIGWIKGSATIEMEKNNSLTKEEVLALKPFKELLEWKKDPSGGNTGKKLGFGFLTGGSVISPKIPGMATVVEELGVGENQKESADNLKEIVEVEFNDQIIKVLIDGEFYNLHHYVPFFFRDIIELGFEPDGHFLIESNDACNDAHYCLVKNGEIYEVESNPCKLENIINVMSAKVHIFGTLVPSLQISRKEMEELRCFLDDGVNYKHFIKETMFAAYYHEKEANKGSDYTIEEVASDYAKEYIEGYYSKDQFRYLLVRILPLLYECEIKIQDGERFYFLEWQNESNDKEMTCSVLPLLNNEHEELSEPPLDDQKDLKQEQWIQSINLTPENQLLEKVQQNPWWIQLIENPTEALYLEAIKGYGPLIRNVRVTTEEMQLEATKQHPLTCWMVEDISDEAMDQAVTLWDWTRDIIKNKSIQKDVLSVMDNWELIKDTGNPVEPVQMAAVMERPYAVNYIENPTERIQWEAVSSVAEVIRFLPNPSEKVQLKAIEEDGFNIRYIQNPTPKVQLASVMEKFYGAFNIRFIQNPTEEVIDTVLKNPQFIREEAERLIKNFQNDYDGLEYTSSQIEKIDQLLKRKNE